MKTLKKHWFWGGVFCLLVLDMIRVSCSGYLHGQQFVFLLSIHLVCAAVNVFLIVFRSDRFWKAALKGLMIAAIRIPMLFASPIVGLMDLIPWLFQIEDHSGPGDGLLILFYFFCYIGFLIILLVAAAAELIVRLAVRASNKRKEGDDTAEKKTGERNDELPLADPQGTKQNHANKWLPFAVIGYALLNNVWTFLTYFHGTAFISICLSAVSAMLLLFLVFYRSKGIGNVSLRACLAFFANSTVYLVYVVVRLIVLAASKNAVSLPIKATEGLVGFVALYRFGIILFVSMIVVASLIATVIKNLQERL